MQQYEIVLQGHLDQRRSSMFPGMTMICLPGGETKLTGWVLDQAALHCMLSKIRNLGMPLLLVRLKSSKPKGGITSEPD